MLLYMVYLSNDWMAVTNLTEAAFLAVSHAFIEVMDQHLPDLSATDPSKHHSLQATNINMVCERNLSHVKTFLSLHKVYSETFLTFVLLVSLLKHLRAGVMESALL